MGAEVVLCVSEVGWFFFFNVGCIYSSPKIGVWFFFQTALIFACASKGCCVFSEVFSTQILDCIFSIYRVLSSLGDSSVPLNCPKWKQSPFGNPSAYSSHGWMFFSGSSCASWGHCFSHSCMSPLPAPGYTSPLDMPARMVVCLLPGLLQANEFHLN